MLAMKVRESICQIKRDTGQKNCRARALNFWAAEILQEREPEENLKNLYSYTT